MSIKSMAVSAIEDASIQITEKGAAKAIRSIPKEKQNAVIGILFVTGILILLFADIMRIKKKWEAHKPNRQDDLPFQKRDLNEAEEY
jgi:hypothetical protein